MRMPRFFSLPYGYNTWTRPVHIAAVGKAEENDK